MLFKSTSPVKPKCSSFTLMLIPEKYGSSKTLHISRLQIKIIFLLCFIILGLASALLLSYRSLKENYNASLESYKELKTFSTSQQREIAELKKDAEELKTKLEELSKFQEEIKAKTLSSQKNSAVNAKTGTNMCVTASRGADASKKSTISPSSFKPLILPAAGAITCYFGVRSNPFGGKRSEFHHGIDIADSYGTKILASADGTVKYSGWDSTYGRMVIISHGHGYQTLYGHNSKLLVKQGELIKKGQAIALMGSTGRSTGTHVHFEVQLNGEPVNPLKIINGGK